MHSATSIPAIAPTGLTQKWGGGLFHLPMLE
jgi:hypothetical protein